MCPFSDLRQRVWRSRLNFLWILEPNDGVSQSIYRNLQVFAERTEAVYDRKQVFYGPGQFFHFIPP